MPGAGLCPPTPASQLEPTGGSRALQVKGLQGNEPYPSSNQLYLEREELAVEVGYVGWKDQPFPPDRTKSEVIRK